MTKTLSSSLKSISMPNAGSVASVSALTITTTGTDITSTVANSTTTPTITINIPTASASNRGVLSSADWTTFNGKQSALTLGTGISTWLDTPSSANLLSALTDKTGTGTLVFATSPTLVTPVLGTPSSGDLSSCTNAVGYGIKSATTTVSVSAATAPTTGQVLMATSSTAATWQTPASGGGTVTSVAALTVGATGTDVTSTVATGTTTPVITLNIPNASASNRGVLSSADWTTFNGKQSALTLGTGVQTWLGTPSSANLLSALTDKTGTGLLVFNTSPALTTPTVTGHREVKVAMAANNIDLATGNIFTKTITVATTLTISNVPAAGTVATFILDLTNGGAFAITWWGVKWASATAPTLTAAGRDSLAFYTHDGGTTWTGLLLGKDLK